MMVFSQHSRRIRSFLLLLLLLHAVSLRRRNQPTIFFLQPAAATTTTMSLPSAAAATGGGKNDGYDKNGTKGPERDEEEGADEVGVRVTVLGRGDVAEASEVMARAFCGSPSYRHILAKYNHDDNEARIRTLRWLFTKNLHLLLDRCPSACKCIRLGPAMGGGKSGSKIVGTMVWTPSEHEEVDLWTLLWYGGGFELPFRLGWAGFRNLLSVLDEFKQVWKEFSAGGSAAAVAAAATGSSWIILERMTVLPEYQGKGIGRRALQRVLSETPKGQQVRLVTQEERNVKFYKKLGFEVVGERDMGVGDPENMYHSWFMVPTA